MKYDNSENNIYFASLLKKKWKMFVNHSFKEADKICMLKAL